MGYKAIIFINKISYNLEVKSATLLLVS